MRTGGIIIVVLAALPPPGRNEKAARGGDEAGTRSGWRQVQGTCRPCSERLSLI